MMSGHQERYDDAMFAFSTGDFDAAIEGLRAVLRDDPAHFDAQLSLGMAHYRKGDYPSAIREGHKAEQLNPREPLVHTNLSLFYMKAGDKAKAEHHGMQARVTSWRDQLGKPGEEASDPSLSMAEPDSAPTPTPPTDFPEMPWKKKS